MLSTEDECDMDHVWINSSQKDMPTISDSGTAAEIVSLVVAERLVKEGVVDQIHPMEGVTIQFGMEGATAPVVGYVMGQGLLGKLYVVDNKVPLVLISAISFTEKGGLIIQDDQYLFCYAFGQIVAEGTRDPSAPRTDVAAMWQLDLRAILQQPDPRIRGKEVEDGQNYSAMQVVQWLQRQWKQGKLTRRLYTVEGHAQRTQVNMCE